MKLIEQGKLELDTYVEEVFPAFANPVIVTGYDAAGKPLTTPAKSKITFGQLLNHSSGLDYVPVEVDPTGPINYFPRAYGHSYKPGEDVSTFFKILQVCAIPDCDVRVLSCDTGLPAGTPTEIRTRD